MVRTYGMTPYQVVVIHGGPGGMGSVAGLARKISETCGALEPLQSQYTINALIEELKEQLLQYSTNPAVLIGHSWGAWLAGLFAARHPDYVSKVILIGCGPLTSGYIAQIGERRKANLTREEAEEFDALNKDLNQPETKDKDKKLSRLGQLASASDYCSKIEIPYEMEDTLPSDGAMYASIWQEAARLRETGELLASFLTIKCPITIIHGKQDPHPYDGVISPLTEHGRKVGLHLLERCGHTPWKERYAATEFYGILQSEILVQA